MKTAPDIRFLPFVPDGSQERTQWTKLPKPPPFRRFLAIVQDRNSGPFWMRAVAGAAPKLAALPGVAAFLLLEREDGSFRALAPLPSGNAVRYLAARDGGLALLTDTAAPGVAPDASDAALLVADGPDLAPLLVAAARAAAEKLPSARLRTPDNEPRFAHHLGWCTWNAFYHGVSTENLRKGFESFRAAGMMPRWVILDDGWQTTAPAPGAKRLLTSLGADEAKFPGGLPAAVRMAKEEFGLHEFLVWHTAFGIPCGLHPDAPELRAFHPRRRERVPLPGIPLDGILGWWEADHVSLPATPEDEFALLDELHDRLRAAGADGVKIDFQAVTAFHSGTDGGRAVAGRALAEALEKTAPRHFRNERISCMACVPELLYAAPRSQYFRASDDFIPGNPATWGERIRNCAAMGLWFGQFVRIDWDMFLSGSSAPAWHAATRVLSGGPVYVADPPGATDGALLRRIARKDGFVPRFSGPAVPARDSVFLDPEAEPDRAFVLVNGKPDAGAAGVFDLDPGGPAPARPRAAEVRAADVPHLRRARRYVAWDGAADGAARVVGRDEPLRVEAGGPDRFSVLTFAPIRKDLFAPLGVLPFLAPGAAIERVGERGPGRWDVRLRAGGTFVVWCARKPAEIRFGAPFVAAATGPIPFRWDAGRSLVFVDVPDEPAAHLLQMRFLAQKQKRGSQP